MAFHWYADGMDRTLDGTRYYNRLRQARAIGGPSRMLLGTEGCSCPGVGTPSGDVNYTSYGMRYDTNSWAR
jgi:hypothetical protein